MTTRDKLVEVVKKAIEKHMEGFLSDDKKTYETVAQAALNAVDNQGLAIVDREPNEAMVFDGTAAHSLQASPYESTILTFKAMLEAGEVK